MSAYLVRPVELPLVCDGRLPLPLHDGLQLWQLVLHEQDLLQVGLALHHDDVRLRVDADLGDVVRALLRVDPHRDAAASEGMKLSSCDLAILNAILTNWPDALATMQIVYLPNQQTQSCHQSHQRELGVLSFI